MSATKQPLRMTRSVFESRSLEDQVEYVRQNGSHALPDDLRIRLLGALGIVRKKERAENLLVFGCYVPYRQPQSLQTWIRLLDRLEVDYTFTDREYCCGLPMVEKIEGEPGWRAKADNICSELNGMNVALAQSVGAKNISYLCTWCALLAKQAYPDGPVSHSYYPDIMLDKLRKKALRVEPSVVGYFEGCHARNKAFAPGIQLDWSTYREMLDRIKGLKVVDMTKWCCISNPDKIVEQALGLNLSTIVCSCTTCDVRLGIAGRGKIRTKYFVDVIQDALDGARI